MQGGCIADIGSYRTGFDSAQIIANHFKASLLGRQQTAFV
jgi:hypothetical protein